MQVNASNGLHTQCARCISLSKCKKLRICRCPLGCSALRLFVEQESGFPFVHGSDHIIE